MKIRRTSPLVPAPNYWLNGQGERVPYTLPEKAAIARYEALPRDADYIEDF